MGHAVTVIDGKWWRNDSKNPTANQLTLDKRDKIFLSQYLIIREIIYYYIDNILESKSKVGKSFSLDIQSE